MGPVLLKKAFPHLVAIITFILVNIIYFYPQLEGKVLQQTDITVYKGMSKELKDYKAKTGEEVLWTNAMFGGMPAYQIENTAKGNMLLKLDRAYSLFFERPIGYFIGLMIGFYLLLTLLGVNAWLSLLAAVAFGFASNHLTLFEAGHVTKVRTISYFALVVAGTILTFKQKYLLGGLVFALGMGLNLFANHPQMTFYLGIALGIYVLMEGIAAVQEKKTGEFIKASGVLLIGLLLALGTSTSTLWTTYEYSKDTMRGEPILLKQAGAASGDASSSVSGLDWEYAMQWSNGFLDVAAGMIPGIVGGGSSEAISSTSDTAISMRKKGARVDQAPLYWGKLPFTAGPVYYGAVFCFLFILGLVVLRGPVKWWLGLASLLLLTLSLGKNFEVFNKLFYNLVPLYNKFRAPSSITSVTTLLIPLLGILTLSKILKGSITKEETLKGLKIAGGITGVFTLFFALVGPSMFDFSAAGDASYQQRGWDVAAFVSDRKALMRTDALRSFVLIAITMGLIWAYVTAKIKQIILILGIGILAVGDNWSVAKRYINVDDFVSSKQNQQSLQLRPVDQQIYAAEKIDPNNVASSLVGRGGYRVFDLSINTFNSSITSYYHNTIGGNHAAKLQRFQDLIDQHISKGTQSVLNMLNTKYVISREGALQQNPNALGPAWFVENIKKVNSPNEEINSLAALNPKEEAVVLDSEFNNYINSFDPQKNGTLQLSSYSPHHLVYQSNSTSEQLAVFSEIWYGPNKGWQAYIDGQPSDHIRANYALRAMRVPSGAHKIEFKFEPSNYFIGGTISLVSSLLTILGLLAFLVYNFIQYSKQPRLEEESTPVVATKLKSTTAKRAIKKDKKSSKKRK